MSYEKMIKKTFGLQSFCSKSQFKIAVVAFGRKADEEIEKLKNELEHTNWLKKQNY